MTLPEANDTVFYAPNNGVKVTILEGACQEDLVAGLVFLMEKAADSPDFDPLAFQGALLAAMTQGVGE